MLRRSFFKALGGLIAGGIGALLMRTSAVASTDGLHAPRINRYSTELASDAVIKLSDWLEDDIFKHGPPFVLDNAARRRGELYLQSERFKWLRAS